MTPEQEARRHIDSLLQDAGGVIQDCATANIATHRGLAIREFPLESGHGDDFEYCPHQLDQDTASVDKLEVTRIATPS